MATLTSDPTTLSPELEQEIRRIFEAQQENQYIIARTTAKERKVKLRKLESSILRHIPALNKALENDLRKSETESIISEYGYVMTEIRHNISHLAQWMAPQRVGTPLTVFGSSSYIHYEPKGVVLIMSPWNYPFQLAIGPLISAIASGNTVIIKPSEFVPHTNVVIKSIVSECFEEYEVAFFEGDASVAGALLKHPFNHIFFTGSPGVGKIVMRAAAEHLTSVTLELGGKSPVIVDETADLDRAGSRIAWLKCMNAGQICIAPDYVLAHEKIKEPLVAKIEEYIKQYYGATVEARQTTPDYCRIINERNFDRLSNLVDGAVNDGASIRTGGSRDKKTLFMDPTVLDNIPPQAAILEEEIFGPILPVIAFSSREKAIEYVNKKPKSLAMYIFAKNRKIAEGFIKETRNGGVVINDCGTHYYNTNLPFGGSNNSGIGKAHGIYGFQEFSNARGVLVQAKYFPSTDFMIPPYGGKLARYILNGIIKYF